MKQIIPIDENAQIVIDPLNYILQYRRKSKRCLSYRTDGYFPNLTSLCIEYLSNAPQRAEHAIRSIEELIQVIEKAESRIRESIN